MMNGQSGSIIGQNETRGGIASCQQRSRGISRERQLLRRSAPAGLHLCPMASFTHSTILAINRREC